MANKNIPLKADQATRVFISIVLTTDVLMAALAFFVAYILRLLIPIPAEAEGIRPFVDYLPMLMIHVVSLVSVFFFANLYSLKRASRVDEYSVVIVAVTIGTLIGVALVSLGLREFMIGQDYSRIMVGYAWICSIVFIILARFFNGWLRKALIRRGWGRHRVLLVGMGDVARMILQKLLWSPELGYDTVGIVSLEEEGPEDLLGVKVVGVAVDLTSIITALQADEVIIALPEGTSHWDIMNLISMCERGRVTVRVYPDLFQIVAGPVNIGELGGIPILTVRDIALSGWRRVAKRLMDIAGATVGLIILSPFMLFIAILIKLESKGSSFYVQERMGLDARPFPIIKFRSMKADAEKSGPGWTTEDDPRKTKIGTFLRKTNLDELPQFINVFLGDMSLVGPRPERPVYVEQFRRSIPRYMDRHREKAGMAGWAQVNGYRGDTSIAERTKYDVWYVENCSLLLDIKIILRTILQFFHSPNAY
ncbi:MAG: undecaprenyl-phosphate glucose phosphotransferase [Anaerolineales bacterium]|nr:MAG: undecaprenyl-phosphate glucose phosphotransferase [Anaerolineales bacterium]